MNDAMAKLQELVWARDWYAADAITAEALFGHESNDLAQYYNEAMALFETTLRVEERSEETSIKMPEDLAVLTDQETNSISSEDTSQKQITNAQDYMETFKSSENFFISYIIKKYLENFKEVNRIWQSNDYFGFSVQYELLQKFGYNQFIECVGWKKDNIWRNHYLHLESPVRGQYPYLPRIIEHPVFRRTIKINYEPSPHRNITNPSLPRYIPPSMIQKGAAAGISLIAKARPYLKQATPHLKQAAAAAPQVAGVVVGVAAVAGVSYLAYQALTKKAREEREQAEQAERDERMRQWQVKEEIRRQREQVQEMERINLDILIMLEQLAHIDS